MILKSREANSRVQRARRLVHPKKSHGRTFKYWGKRILRIRATPHSLALGFAIGVFAAFSPALGVHFLMAIVLAFMFGGNFVAASLATAAANPLTYPFMIAGNYEIGNAILGRSLVKPVSMHEVLGRLASFDFGGMWDPVFKPLFLGSLILGTFFACAAYGVIYFFARAYEEARAERRRQREVLLP